MSLYVSPEQMMADRAEFARKGIAKGRSVVVVSCDQGVVFVAENPSPLLHKISEIYDRIGFAAVGRYTEFENLRIQGIQYADLRGYTYDRRDVSARGLANQYASLLGAAFAAPTGKPFEVDLVVAELGESPENDAIFTIGFDGTLGDHRHHCVLGQHSEALTSAVATLELSASPSEVVEAVRSGLGPDAPVEVALLDRTSTRQRCFRRLEVQEDRS